ncbi:hypothetical protein [uncultured Photobacterium sp.]|uniref:hypothetical protein n=1 Tax=uncultured Photobacterium sp. TaxID=173973 RepID=UPI0026058400|nr:hypothetical protein [uncultured Photobacterium sp.]
MSIHVEELPLCKNHSDFTQIQRCKIMDLVIKRQIYKVKLIQAELRQAIITSKYNKVDILMVLLDQAQIELEAIYLP